MTNLALSKKEAKDSAGACSPCDSDSNLPVYPYGLQLYLDDETLKKLGITDMPKVGTVMVAQISVKVTGTSERAYQDNEGKEESRACVDMQITDMDLAPPVKDLAKSLYTKSN